MHAFPAAPWSLSLKVISLVSTVAFVGVGSWTIYVWPIAFGNLFTAIAGLACLAWGALALSALFAVRSYTLDGQMLRVQRLLWSTTVDISGVTAASDGASLYPGSLRVCGNAGLFSFSGLFYNRNIGIYRAFVTNWKRALILHRQRRSVVISPADPHAMVIALQAAFPQLADASLKQAL